MQLPRGTLVKSLRGPKTPDELGQEIEKESITGYVRVSRFHDGKFTDCVVVTSAGKPIMSFVSDGDNDLADREFVVLTRLLAGDDAIVELCRLGEKQVQLLQELYPDFGVKTEEDTPPEPAPQPAMAVRPAAVPAKPGTPAVSSFGQAIKTQQRPVVKATIAPQHTPQQAPQQAPQQGPKPQQASADKTIIRPVPKFETPVIRGKFVRSAEVENIEEYLEKYPDATGHLSFIARLGTDGEEYHVIAISGRIEAVYNDRGLEFGLPAGLSGVGGLVEFYAVDEPVITSVLARYQKKEAASIPVKARPVWPLPLPVPQEPVAADRPAIRPRSVPAASEPVRAPVPRPVPPPKTEEAVEDRPLFGIRWGSSAEPVEAPAAQAEIGIPAKVLIQKSMSPSAVPVEEDISRTLDDLSIAMDDDIAMVRRVELDFASHVDDLLIKLELGHLRKPEAKQ